MKKDTIISIANFHRFALGACPLIFSLFVVLPIVLSIGVSSVLAFFSIERVSVDSSGNQGNGDCSGWGGISADGRYVAFESSASNLVPGDTNGTWDIFVRDRQTNTNTIVSIDCSGNQADGGGLEAIISADGRYVAFQSNATNLVPGDTNGAGDVFVRDLQANTTTRISVDSSGNQGNSFSGQASISADGNHVAFFSRATNLVPGDTNGHDDIFVRDRQTNTNTIVSVDSSGNQGNNDSFLPSISADGRCVAFDSYASNLVPGVTNGQADIFVRDRQDNTITIVSVDSSGNQGNRES